MQVSKTVNSSMSAELDAQSSNAASNVDAFFERYFGITECLASTQIIRDTTVEQTEGGIATHRLFGSLVETLRTNTRK